MISNTPTSVTITWVDPLETDINDRDGITGYQLRVDNGAWQDIGNIKMYVIEDLSPGRSFEVEIRAVNKQGAARDIDAGSLTVETQSEGFNNYLFNLYVYTLYLSTLYTTYICLSM